MEEAIEGKDQCSHCHKRNLRRGVVFTAFVSGVLILGFFAGRIYQYCKSGYSYEVLKEETIPFRTNTLSQKRVFERIGLEIPNMETTILVLGENTIIYKAKKGFPDGLPSVQNLTTHENTINWEDGFYHYNLKIEEISLRNIPETE